MSNPQSSFTNLHIHTPYSFSAFSSVEQAVQLAKKEGVTALGISDFDTIDGYPEFAQACKAASVHPCFGIETMALSVEDQERGRRWNDPGNPGRIYFCAKGLTFPSNLSQSVRNRLRQKHEAMQAQIREMVSRVNHHLDAVGLAEYQGKSLRLDYELIRSTMTEGTVREHHLVKSLQKRIAEVETSPDEREELLRGLYGGTESKVDVSDSVALQDELRANLLKAGKPAFVPEDTLGYLSFEAARDLIVDMGGIPCYPILADGTKGEPTEIEADPDRLAEELLERKVYCVEFIPARNDIDVLRSYVRALHARGVPALCGTEHNTPALEPMAPACKGGVPFDEEMKDIFWEGACVIAGHQRMKSLGQDGFIGSSKPDTLAARVTRFREIGEREILNVVGAH